MLFQIRFHLLRRLQSLKRLCVHSKYSLVVHFWFIFFFTRSFENFLFVLRCIYFKISKVLFYFRKFSLFQRFWVLFLDRIWIWTHFIQHAYNFPTILIFTIVLFPLLFRHCFKSKHLSSKVIEVSFPQMLSPSKAFVSSSLLFHPFFVALFYVFPFVHKQN